MAVDQKPILISGPPRCGTTMLAGLIAPHGVWVGNARTTWYPGTNPEFAAENQDIKGVLKRFTKNELGYRNWRVPLPEQPDEFPGMKEEIEAFVPDDQRWLVKTSWTVLLHKFWKDAYPQAYWILPKRERMSILKSVKRHPRMARRPIRMSSRFVHALQKRQHKIADQVANRIWVDVLRISRNDKSEIEKLFQFLQIEPDFEKINKWIEPGRMRK